MLFFLVDDIQNRCIHRGVSRWNSPSSKAHILMCRMIPCFQSPKENGVRRGKKKPIVSFHLRCQDINLHNHYMKILVYSFKCDYCLYSWAISYHCGTHYLCLMFCYLSPKNFITTCSNFKLASIWPLLSACLVTSRIEKNNMSLTTEETRP